ncbi:MAG TPA: M28 family peptidase [Gemmatimonadales bacterium]|nr:M28 family peptidase [Gemmatimonadales bacterium]
MLVPLLLLLAAPVAAQMRDPLAVTEAELDAHLRILSSDLFEGRFPGRRGEALTTAYLASQLQAAGLQPGANGAWLQEVKLLVHDPVPGATPEVKVSGAQTRDLAHGRDLRLSNLTAGAEVAAGGDAIFAGYGISAPIYGWDDLAGTDLAGKVVIARIGEPMRDTTRFNGVRASRYAWLTSKTRELEKRGAVGVLWLLPSGSRMSMAPVGGQRRLLGDGESATLRFSGNLTDSTLASLLPAGTRLDELLEASERPGFKPLPLGVRIDVRLQTSPRIVTTHNVVGTVPGRDPKRATEHVVLSAHWDAYGIGTPVDGDSIYNGALDDASGTSALLALARVFQANPQPRSITFLFTTAEEWGLLGAHAFVRHGPIPMDRVTANLNLDDGIELWGRKKDVASLGVELSSLGAVSAEVAKRMKLRITPDPYPQEGFYLRQDGFVFAEAGVPSLYMALGTDAEGRPAGWVDERVKQYLGTHYHRPSDEYDTVVVNLEGAVQYAHYVRDVAIAVARMPGRPTWNRGGEFSRP